MSSAILTRGVLRRPLAGLFGVLVGLAVWQLFAGVVIRTSTLPTATATIGRLISLVGTGPFWTAVGQTLITAGVGFLASLPLAIVIGVLTGMSPLAYRAFRVTVEVLKPIPPIVILPLVVLKAGSTARMAEILILFTVVPSLIVIVAAGVRDTDPVALNTARSFGLGRWARVRRIVMPSALPFLATGLRISIAGAVVTAVMAEIVAGAPGLGDQVNIARTAGNSTATFAYVVALGVLGIVLTYALNRIERRMLRWHISIRATDGERSEVLATLRGRVAGSTPASSAASTLEGLADWADLQRLKVWRSTARAQERLRARRPQLVGLSRLVRGSGGEGEAQRSHRALGLVLEIGVPLALVVAWWVWSAHAHSLYFPPASKIVSTFRRTWLFSHFGSDAVPSLENLVLGLLLGAVVGLAIGIITAELPYLGDMLDPVVVFFRSIPGVAYVPIMIILIGFTAPMRIASIALASMFPILIATVDGLRGIDAMVDQVTRAYGISRWRRLLLVRLPAAGPRIASGVEVSIAVAVVVMVASELEGTVHGIGAQTILAQQSFDITGMWSGILLLALIGLVANLLFRAVRLRVLRWYYESRPDATLG